MPVSRIESMQNAMNGTATYDLGNGKWATFSAEDVRRYGLARLLEAEGVELPPERVPVMQRGRRVGTVPAGFDPLNARSTTFLYDMRPGDFRRDGDAWVADKTLGPGDLEAVDGFTWG